FKFNLALHVFLVGMLLLFPPAPALAGEPGEVALEAKLIWGTNEAQSPNPKHKPVSPELAKKLKNSPFKWESYFEVNSECFRLAPGKDRTVPMSKTCEVRIKNLGDSQIELRLFGKGKQVSKVTQALP